MNYLDNLRSDLYKQTEEVLKLREENKALLEVLKNVKKSLLSSDDSFSDAVNIINNGLKKVQP